MTEVGTDYAFAQREDLTAAIRCLSRAFERAIEADDLEGAGKIARCFEVVSAVRGGTP